MDSEPEHSASCHLCRVFLTYSERGNLEYLFQCTNVRVLEEPDGSSWLNVGVMDGLGWQGSASPRINPPITWSCS